MKKTLLRNILMLCGFGLTFGALNAQTSTWTGSVDSAFENGGNWSLTTMPNGDTRAQIPSGSNVLYNVALSTLDGANTQSYITHLNMEADATLTVSEKLWVYSKNGTAFGEGVVDGNYTGGNLILNTGADMNFRRNLYWGTSTNAGSITVNDGVINNKNAFVIGENGNGTMTVNGGTVSTDAGDIIVGGYTGYGSITLNGGFLKPKPSISLDTRADRVGAGHITIDGGTIEFTNDLSALVNGWILDGKLKAVAGKKINVEVIPAIAEDPFADPPVVAAPARTLITAVASAPKEVAYLTKSKTMGAGASAVDNDAIIRMLQADANFNVTVIVDPSSTIDLSSYDLVIAQETFGSGDAIWNESLAIKNITVPTIYNKTYALLGSKNHITDANTAIIEPTALSMTVSSSVRRMDPLFSGIDFSGGNDVQIFNALSNDDGSVGGAKGFQILTGIDIANNTIGGGTLHGTVVDAAYTPTVPVDGADLNADVVFNELRAGVQVGENALDVLQAPVIAFSMNYGAIANGDGANLTSEALTIWRNAAYHLTGMMSPSTLYANPALSIEDNRSVSNVSTDVRAIGNRIYVSNVKSASEINIYSITGALVKSFKTNEDTDFNFKSGLWIATVKTFEGQKSVKLLTK
jgi:hypothetical protein